MKKKTIDLVDFSLDQKLKALAKSLEVCQNRPCLYVKTQDKTPDFFTLLDDKNLLVFLTQRLKALSRWVFSITKSPSELSRPTGSMRQGCLYLALHRIKETSNYSYASLFDGNVTPP